MRSGLSFGRHAALLFTVLLLCSCHTKVSSSPNAPTPTPQPTPPGCTSPTPPPVAQTVTTNADSGAGSLRATIAAAPANGYITFASSLTGATIALTSGGLAISNSVTILGPCPNVTITGSGAGPLISVAGGVSANLNNLTLTSTGGTALGVASNAFVIATGLVIDGSTAASCPALTVAAGTGTVNLVSTTISGNTASGDGIVCQSGATLFLDKDAFSNNTTAGAGVLDLNSGNTQVMHSEFDGNKAGPTGGAITQLGGFLVISNTLLYNNSSASGAGMFVASGANATIDNITVAGNASPQLTNAGIAGLHNTIVANANPAGPDVSGTVSSTGYNFITNKSGSSGWIASDILGKTLLLYKFGYYGGPTDSMPPTTGALVINAGDPANGTCPATDQRELTRPIDGRCDIGSVEYNFASPP